MLISLTGCSALTIKQPTKNDTTIDTLDSDNYAPDAWPEDQSTESDSLEIIEPE